MAQRLAYNGHAHLQVEAAYILFDAALRCVRPLYAAVNDGEREIRCPGYRRTDPNAINVLASNPRCSGLYLWLFV